jgi:uncharacterized protein with PIN domain
MTTPADTPLLLDVMCGKLATYLRMGGYDAAYALDRDVEADDELLAWADREDRLLVTRDVDLAERTDRAILLQSLDVTDQLAELATEGFDLSLTEPARCATCNAELHRVADGDETPGYAPAPAERRVWHCPDCGQHFWRGSHWADVERTLAQIESPQR